MLLRLNLVGLFLAILNSVTFLQFHGCLGENITGQIDFLNERLSESDESYFAVLYSHKVYAKFAAKEEELVKICAQRRNRLQVIFKKLMGYLTEYYKFSAGVQSLNEFPPKITSLQSSAVLKHKRTKRLSQRLHQLGYLQFFGDFLENSNSLKQVLNETQPFILTDDNRTHNVKRLGPSSQDLYMSMKAHTDVGNVYGYSPSQITTGFNPKISAKLSYNNFMEIGLFALTLKLYQLAVDWSEVAGKYIHIERGIPQDQTLASGVLRLAIQEHNKRRTDPNLQLLLNVNMAPITTEIGNRYSFRDYYSNSGNGYGPKGNNTLYAQLRHLCLGKTLQPPEIAKNFKCYYETRKNPYLYINPVKVEHLSDTPPLYQMYEILSNRSIQNFIELYSEKVHPAFTGPPAPTLRTGGYKYLPSEDVPDVMFDIPEAVLGMKMRDKTEYFQYVEFTPGRYFDSHPDQLPTYEIPKGVSPHDEFLATMLYLLEVPELGVSTAFCEGGVHSHSEIGSAIVWINIRTNTTTKNIILHA